jgi:hypothetical protein
MIFSALPEPSVAVPVLLKVSNGDQAVAGLVEPPNGSSPADDSVVAGAKVYRNPLHRLSRNYRSSRRCCEQTPVPAAAITAVG